MDDENSLVPAEGESNIGEVDNQPLVSNYVEAARLYKERISDSVVEAMRISQLVAQSMGPALDKLGQMLIEAQKVYASIQPVLETFKEISTSIAQSIADFKLPTLTEERKQEILSSHQQWGYFGWTWLPTAPIKYFYEPPLNITDANIKAKPYCTAEAMEQTFNCLRRYKLRKDDLESAIYCFQNRQYKACSLLLFGLIEAKLIRKQTKEWRNVGIGAVKELRGQLEEDEQTKMFFTSLCCANLLAYLETIFAKAENFKSEPAVINRNFVDHGMSTRRIRKRDCIQLFFALQNLLQLTEEGR